MPALITRRRLRTISIRASLSAVSASCSNRIVRGATRPRSSAIVASSATPTISANSCRRSRAKIKPVNRSVDGGRVGAIDCRALTRAAAKREPIVPRGESAGLPCVAQRHRAMDGARGGTRTHTPLQDTDFKSVAYTIPPPGHGVLRAKRFRILCGPRQAGNGLAPGTLLFSSGFLSHLLRQDFSLADLLVPLRVRSL